MGGATALRRPAMKPPLSTSPLLRATSAFGVAIALGSAPRFLHGLDDGWETLVVYGLAAMACTAGILVLIQSAAIRKIQELRGECKEQLDELARWALYTEQITEALTEANRFRREPRAMESMQSVDRLLASASTRASVALDPSVRFYLVESSLNGHVVKARAGTEPFAIEVGKSCPADRSLAEVAERLARFHRIVQVSMRGTQMSLVLLCERKPSRADCTFLEQLGLAISLTQAAGGPKSRPRSHGHLRAV